MKEALIESLKMYRRARITAWLLGYGIFASLSQENASILGLSASLETRVVGFCVLIGCWVTRFLLVWHIRYILVELQPTTEAREAALLVSRFPLIENLLVPGIRVIPGVLLRLAAYFVDMLSFMLAINALARLAPSIAEPIGWIGAIILVGLAWNINVQDGTEAEVKEILSGDLGDSNGQDFDPSGT